MDGFDYTLLVTLVCNHTVWIDFELKQQYPDDTHYIRCPFCTETKEPTAWQKVNSCRELNDVSDVPSGTPFILRDSVMRLQPSVPSNRIRPFPYKPNRRRRSTG